MSLTKSSYSMTSGAPINILDYGADPTGVASSSAAFSAVVGLNRTVILPAGTYKLASSVVIPNSCFTKFIGEANVPVPATQLIVDFDGPAFTSAVGNTSFYSFENLIVTVNNPTVKTLTAFVADSGDSVHCEFKNITLKLFKQPAILLTAGFVCNFEHILIQDCYNYGIKVVIGSDNSFKRVLADHTDGGGMDLFGSGYVIDNYYTEWCCRRNDPATFNETWYDLSLSGSCHTIVGGIISAYPQNNKSPIYFGNSLDTSIIGMRGFALGTGAPSFIYINGSDGGLVLNQSSSLSVSGYLNNLVNIEAKGGLSVNPDIVFSNGRSVQNSIAKAWACLNGTTGVLKQSQGVQSLVKNATGDYTVIFHIGTFNNANYVFSGTGTGTDVNYGIQGLSKTTDALNFITFNTTTGVNVDCPDVSLLMIGV